MEAALPPDEERRLEVLRDLEILDTDPEEDFDSVVRLVARLLDVPIALVSLVDTNRQWFKACYGLDTRETDRSSAFCAHAILGGADPLIVENAPEDPRFADNPLVTGPPHLRFYLGVPLVTSEGAAIGTLCALDTEPRTPSDEDVRTVQEQAAVVVAHLELRRASRNLVQRNADLERSNQLMRQFQRALAHDVMTPIQQIGFFAEQLDGAVEPEGRRSLDNVQNGLRRLERLVDALRKFVATGGKLTLTRTPMDEVFATAIEEHRAELDSIGATVTVSAMPAVLGHGEHLGRVASNLLSNAIKYRSARPLTIDITAERRGPRVRFQVRDNGIGIAPKYQERVFEPMRRLHAEGEIPGVGLGLALVRQVVEGSGGKAGLESERDVGTTVWFELVALD
ncbi:MAG: ATP-binding protein [Planctomycetota bacterium]